MSSVIYKDLVLKEKFGLQTLSNFYALEDAIAYKPSHISLYGLEIHERTPFGKNLQICKWVNEFNN